MDFGVEDKTHKFLIMQTGQIIQKSFASGAIIFQAEPKVLGYAMVSQKGGQTTVSDPGEKPWSVPYFSLLFLSKPWSVPYFCRRWEIGV
jgi:hypothetical protein